MEFGEINNQLSCQHSSPNYFNFIWGREKKKGDANMQVPEFYYILLKTKCGEIKTFQVTSTNTLSIYPSLYGATHHCKSRLSIFLISKACL
jgi:hypothetical protein